MILLITKKERKYDETHFDIFTFGSVDIIGVSDDIGYRKSCCGKTLGRPIFEQSGTQRYNAR